MTLLDLVNNSIGDETQADNEYEKMIELVKKEDKLSDTEKGLIAAMIFKINTDEETHQVMLKTIKDVLEQ